MASNRIAMASTLVAMASNLPISWKILQNSHKFEFVTRQRHENLAPPSQAIKGNTVPTVSVMKVPYPIIDRHLNIPWRSKG